MEPGNRFQGMNSARLCSLAGRYDNLIPLRFLAPIDYLNSSSEGLTAEEKKHEANTRGWKKTVHVVFKYLSRTCRKGWRRAEYRAGIFKQSMRTRNRVGIGLSYRPARARIFKRLWSPEIDSKASIPPAYVA
jgi:hypothetical protein